MKKYTLKLVFFFPFKLESTVEKSRMRGGKATNREKRENPYCRSNDQEGRNETLHARRQFLHLDSSSFSR